MEFDFESLPVPGRQNSETEPRALLRTLPVRAGAINDLWDGQAQALTQWDKVRHRPDNLILLNTGAGKTIVGLLIAESLRRETRGNIVYLCANNDLVAQVSREADRLGLDHTVRADQKWSNSFYEQGKAICITNYQAAINPFSQFKGERTPSALILDDAHVAEGLIRDAYSLRLTQDSDGDLYRAIRQIILDGADSASWRALLIQVLTGTSSFSSIIAPPLLGLKSQEQLSAAFEPYLATKDLGLAISLATLHGKWHLCSFCVSSGAIEISPPALPVLAHRLFSDNSIRRVYLSATLEEGVDFARAFGRGVSDPIRPQVDAGNGERLILFSERVGGEAEELPLAAKIISAHKALLAVPTYNQSRRWREFAVPVEGKEFSPALDAFRRASRGAFIIVGRYDGIDLPADSCRVMIIDGVPRGSSLLERFSWEYLDLQGELRSRIATRVTQMFGRIIRGRVDFGAFIVVSRPLNNWLSDDRNVALLPELLRKQLRLGNYVHEALKITDKDKAAGLIANVLARNDGWTNFYARFVNSGDVDGDVISKSVDQQKIIADVATAWARLWSTLWTNMDVRSIQAAREELENLVPRLAEADSRAAGWLNIWLGTSYMIDGQEASAADHFGRARNRLRVELPLPRARPSFEGALDESQLSPLAKRFLEMCRGGSIQANNRIHSEDRLLEPILDDASSATAFEEACRQLGECLGYESSRPDNELGIGPDVLWVDQNSKLRLGIEAKTDKVTDKYNKKEIGQAHQHAQWLLEKCGPHESLGVFLVGSPTAATDDSSPSPEMFRVQRQKVKELLGSYRDLRSAIRSEIGASRLSGISKIGVDDDWSLRAVARRLEPEPIAKS